MQNSVLGNRPRAQRSSFTTTKDWSLDSLVSSGSRFRRVSRISATLDLSDLLRQVSDHEVSGIPLIIEGWETRPEWPSELFNLDWLRAQYGTQVLEARNVHGDRVDRHLQLSELLDIARAAPPFATEDETERLYGKDMECPPEWQHWLTKKFILDSIRPHAHTDVLPMSVQTLMCYLGISDTFTPCHKDLCGSTGQNLMCYTETGGSSFWFMTKGSAAPAVARYFHELGHELDWESHVTTISEFANAPFDVYIAEQKLGDLVIVPPRSCHQVVNRGGVTMKTSWSRMTIRGLEIAVYHELPIYRRVCRPEVYRVKYTIYQTMLKHLATLEEERERHSCFPSLPTSLEHTKATEVEAKIRQLTADLSKLLDLFDEVLQQEYCRGHEDLPHHAAEHCGNTCDFCGADIFQSFFHCTSCGSHDDGSHQPSSEHIVVCSGCFVEGRACKCGDMQIGQCGQFSVLLQSRNKVANALQDVHRAGLSEVDPQTVTDGFYVANGLPVFDAARRLCDSRQKYRRANKVTRACTLRGKEEPSHSVPYASSLNCRTCHASKCFEHILELGIHASEAIMEHSADNDNEFWHRRHHTGKQNYERVLPELLHAIRLGNPYKLRDRLVYAASNFSTVRPLRENMSLGFYDKLPLIAPAAGSQRHEPSSSEVHPPLEADKDPMLLEEKLLSTKSDKRETRKRREVMDCVLIIRKPKKNLKRRRLSVLESSNKRAKLTSSTVSSEQTSPIEDPLFIPSPGTSVEDSDNEQDDTGPSKRSTNRPASHPQRIPSLTSSSSSDDQLLFRSNANMDRSRHLAVQNKPGPKSVRKPVPSFSAPRRIPSSNFYNASHATDPRNAYLAGTSHSRLPGPSRPNGAQFLRSLRDRVAGVEQESSGLLTQNHQQGHLLKLTRDKLKLTDDQVSRMTTEIRKLQENVKDLQTELQYQTKRVQNQEFMDSAMEKSRWWKNQVESQKRELERYVQGQLRLERQRQQESINDAVEEAIQALGPAPRAADPDTLISTLKAMMTVRAQATTTPMAGRVMPPPPTTDHRESHGPSSQLLVTPFQNVAPDPAVRTSAGMDEHEPHERQRYSHPRNSAESGPKLALEDQEVGDDEGYDRRPTPDLAKGSRTHQSPVFDILAGGHDQHPSLREAWYSDHPLVAGPQQEAGPSNLSHSDRVDLHEPESPYRSRDPRRLRKNERPIEGSHVGRSLLDRIESPGSYSLSPHDETDLSIQYPAEGGTPTDRYQTRPSQTRPKSPSMGPRKNKY